MIMWDRALERVRASSQVRESRRSPGNDVSRAFDRVVLADGSLYSVPRNNLAAAKGLLAAQNAIARRMRAEREMPTPR